MPSKLVSHRKKLSDSVEAAVGRYGDRASQTFMEKLRPYVDDGTPEVDLSALLRLLSRALTGAQEEMIAADRTRDVAKGADIAPRRRRDETADVVFQHVSDLRGVAERLFGTGASAELLRVYGRTSRDPVLLHQQATLILERLSDPEIVWPESRYEIEISLEGCAEDLRPHVEALGKALKDVRKVQRRIEDDILAKTAAMDAYDRTYLSISQIVEAVLRFGGYGEIAERVRPTRRTSPQPRPLDEDPADPTPDDDGPPSPGGFPRPGAEPFFTLIPAVPPTSSEDRPDVSSNESPSA